MLTFISTHFAIYFVLWWVVLFVTLPLGVRSQHEAGERVEGSDPGAPDKPYMGRKILLTSAISAVLYACALVAHRAGYLNIERLSKMMGVPI